ncbi:MAG: hypothetical protein AB7F43_13330 [Bacteriovoracia bacterium]
MKNHAVVVRLLIVAVLVNLIVPFHPSFANQADVSSFYSSSTYSILNVNADPNLVQGVLENISYDDRVRISKLYEGYISKADQIVADLSQPGPVRINNDLYTAFLAISYIAGATFSGAIFGGIGFGALELSRQHYQDYKEIKEARGIFEGKRTALEEAIRVEESKLFNEQILEEGIRRKGYIDLQLDPKTNVYVAAPRVLNRETKINPFINKYSSVEDDIRRAKALVDSLRIIEDAHTAEMNLSKNAALKFGFVGASSLAAVALQVYLEIAYGEQIGKAMLVDRELTLNNDEKEKLLPVVQEMREHLKASKKIIDDSLAQAG